MSKGKQPWTRVNKVPKLLLSEIKEVYIEYGQEIGLEAAIFWRPRNRALILYFHISTENLTDLNNIPIPCPYNFIIIYYCLCGVVEHWINIRLFLFKELYKIFQVIMLTWVTKKNILYSRLKFMVFN